MRTSFSLLCLTCLALGGCGKGPTVEERALLQIFSGLVAAQTYDEVCNKTDPKSRYDMKDQGNVNEFGNMQLLAGRIGTTRHQRFPQESAADSVKWLTAFHDNVQQRTRSSLEKKGCKSSDTQKDRKVLEKFRTTPPATLNGIIDEQIRQQGASPLPPDAAK
ncbi:MAG: hypothetical protein JWO78_1102 [Micavibrio sp.]|nr:hypothetical protein [Micavibrio sp.]